MKLNKYLRYGVFVLLFCAFSLLSGCQDLHKPEIMSEPVTEGEAAVIITVADTTARTVFPDTSLENVALYRLYGRRSGVEDTMLAEFTGTGTTLKLYPAGIWNFTLYAYDKDDSLILKGVTGNVTLTLGAATPVNFQLFPVIEEGAGNIEIIINFPVDAGITSVTVSGGSEQERFDIEAGEASFTYEKNEVNAGYHFFSFTFYQGEHKASVVSELVEVGNGFTSSKVITLAGAELKPVQPELVDGVWTSDSIPEANTRNVYTFTASSGVQFVHLRFKYQINSLFVRFFDSAGNPLGYGTLSYDDINKYVSFDANIGETYSVTVSSSYVGTYDIAFNNTPLLPESPAAIPLEEGVWAAGELEQGGEQWFTFTASAATHSIHGKYKPQSPLQSSGDMLIELFDRYGKTVETDTRRSGNIWYSKYSLNPQEPYYVKVYSRYSLNSGTYEVAFNNSPLPPGVTSTTLPDNGGWVDGELPEGGEQWFSFNATAAVQFIHTRLDTLRELNFRVYTDTGDEAGTSKIVPAVVEGNLYYVRVVPGLLSNPNTNLSGTYKIAFNASPVTPGTPPLITLEENVWTDNDLPIGGEQWFSFTATADRQVIHINFGTFAAGSNYHNVNIRLYDRNGYLRGDITNLTKGRVYNVSLESISRAVTFGELYYILVTPFNDELSGTYELAFNQSPVPPGVPPAIPLSESTWAEGDLPTKDDEQWFSFTATAATQYIHGYYWYDMPGQGYVQLYDSNGVIIMDDGEFIFHGNGDAPINIGPLVTPGSVYYVRITPYTVGAYKIAVNDSQTPPPPLPAEITLEQDVWADGYVPVNNGELWFAFIPTTPVYIHVNYGSVKSMYVQLYDSNKTAVGDNELISGSGIDKYIYRNGVSYGQKHYIKVTPYNNPSNDGNDDYDGDGFTDWGSNGNYQIAFNTSEIPPFIDIPERYWADGKLFTGGSEQWFSFIENDNTQQYIHVATNRQDMSVEVYDSTTMSRITGLNYEITDYHMYVPVSVVTGRRYYVRVSGGDNNGISNDRSFKIAFNELPIPPDGTGGIDVSPLSQGPLQEYELNGENLEQQWFSFRGTNPQYLFISGMSVYISLYDRDTMTQIGETMTSLITSLDDWPRTKPLYVISGKEYYLRITPWGQTPDTFRIGMSTTTTPNY